MGINVIDNRAMGIACYDPRYTFIEKLHAVVRKYRIFQDSGSNSKLPDNFLRHYYDLYSLISQREVQEFIGTDDYHKHKDSRFGNDDKMIKNCQGFFLSDRNIRDLFTKEYGRTSSLYYRGQIPFEEMLSQIQKILDKL